MLEFGNSIPEGLHRCTTKTSNWFLKPEVLKAGDQIEDNFKVYCTQPPQQRQHNRPSKDKGCVSSPESNETQIEIKLLEEEKNCDRIYHLYKMKTVGAIFIVAEKPRTTVVTPSDEFDQFTDVPVEGQSIHILLLTVYVLLPPSRRKPLLRKIHINLV